MAEYTWPTSSKAYTPSAIVWRQVHNSRTSTSPLNGAVQSVGLPGMRWGLTLEWPEQSYAERALLEGLLSLLSGPEHRINIGDLARPVPLGTIAISGVTMSAAAQFAEMVTLNNCGNATTLQRGDWIGVVTSSGAQMLQVAAAATATSGGVMANVWVRPRLRGAVTEGTAVVLNNPKVKWMLAGPELAIPRGGSNRCPSFSVDFVEVF
jgi:hypothetical protein